MPFVCVIFHVIAYAIYKQSCNCVSPVAISCGPAPDAPANGQRRVSGRIFQSTVTYTCDSGYTLQGDNTRTCMANKRWSGSAPTCIRKLLTIRCSIYSRHTWTSIVHQGNVVAAWRQWGNFINSKANSYETASGKTVYIQVDNGTLFICARCLVWQS